MATLPRLILCIFPAVNFKYNIKPTAGGSLGKVRVNVRGKVPQAGLGKEMVWLG